MSSDVVERELVYRVFCRIFAVQFHYPQRTENKKNELRFKSDTFLKIPSLISVYKLISVWQELKRAGLMIPNYIFLGNAKIG